MQLGDVLDDYQRERKNAGKAIKARWSLSCNEQGFNDYFLFNDLRNGSTTIHSWDIEHTTERQKAICNYILHNRRKSIYGILDGNAMSLTHLQGIDRTISKDELEELVELGFLKHCPYYYEICSNDTTMLTEDELFVLSHNENGIIMVDNLKIDKEFRKRKIGVLETLRKLETDGVVRCTEVRYDFKNTKISTGLNGINRIFLPTSKIYPTLVASDTNDFVSTIEIEAKTEKEWKEQFMEKVYKPHNFRKITKSEACRIQGFPSDYILPETRPRWMKLIGNSVAVPVVKKIAEAVVGTGVFDEKDWNGKTNRVNQYRKPKQLEMFA